MSIPEKPLTMLFVGAGRVQSGCALAVVVPQDPILTIGSSLTATCIVNPEANADAQDLYWTLNGEQLPANLYSLVNDSALKVTLRGLNGSRQQSGDNLLCHRSDNRVLAGSCLYVG
ncbi:hypothetical protein chiPu_0027024, partial [Chiloscyllium punctatum]|nr:hypothetical protein [Chiloscyllium punctatum]